jgi:hypothetical protein
VHDLSAGLASADLIAVDPDGKTWAVECKATASITTAHRAQAMAQGKKARLPWMLASRIDGAGCWLIQRQGHAPTVWRDEKGDD